MKISVWCFLLVLTFSTAVPQRSEGQLSPSPYKDPSGEDIREKFKDYPKVLTKKESQNLIQAHKLILANKHLAAIPLLEPLYKRAPKDKVLYFPENPKTRAEAVPHVLEPQAELFWAYYHAKQWKKLYPMLLQWFKEVEKLPPPASQFESDLRDHAYGLYFPILLEARKYVVGENPSKYAPLVLAPKPPRLIDEPSVKVRGGQMLIAADVLAQQLGLTVETDNAARKVRLASKEKRSHVEHEEEQCEEQGRHIARTRSGQTQWATHVAAALRC